MPKSRVRKKKKSGRRNAPPPPQQTKAKGPSPTWYVALMFGLMALGILVIIVNYIGIILPDSPDNKWLLLGLVGIAGGFGMTLNYH